MPSRPWARSRAEASGSVLAGFSGLGRDLVPHQPALLALPIALLLGVALVVLGLALGQRDLRLHPAALVVQVQRHEREPALLDLADQALDLFLLHQQLLVAIVSTPHVSPC